MTLQALCRVSCQRYGAGPAIGKLARGATSVSSYDVGTRSLALVWCGQACAQSGGLHTFITVGDSCSAFVIVKGCQSRPTFPSVISAAVCMLALHARR